MAAAGIGDSARLRGNATQLISTLRLAIDASCGVPARAWGQLAAQLNDFPLPREGYDHPAV
ncbi:hypothetical protein GCM10020367_15450 [Streptomyces sannanensis]|uniref:Uncharacterized protein n=1 Tax=Streptomyces sannanensis TaxID=285536 RepID=A0ABP6S7T6_9ACTN